MCLKNLYTKRGPYKFQKHKAWGGNCLPLLDKIKNLYPKWIRSEDRVSEELWMKVHDIVQEAVIKTIPKKKKCKTAKWLSEEALPIAEKTREAKGKGGKERYTHLNAEFQGRARRDKKKISSVINAKK